MADKQYVDSVEKSINLSALPGNSNKEKQQNRTEERQKAEKVIKGSVVKRKKSFGQKIKESLFQNREDGDTVSNFALGEVIIPTIKDMLWTVVSGSLEMILFGEVRNSRPRRSGIGGNSNYTPYNSFYNGNPAGVSGQNKKRPNVNRGNFDDPILETREDAYSVVGYLADRIQDYGFASVADLMDAMDQESSFVDLNWGWTNVSEAQVHRVREGWAISLPKVEARNK